MTKPTAVNRGRIDALIVDSRQSLKTIEASRREICAEHNERIRKLRDAETALISARSGAESEMFDIESVLTPELLKLLADPLHSL
jgi:hypothetical protein